MTESGAPPLCAACPANQKRAAAGPAAAGSRSDDAPHRDSVTPMSHQPAARLIIYQIVPRRQDAKTNTDEYFNTFEFLEEQNTNGCFHFHVYIMVYIQKNSICCIDIFILSISSEALFK